MNYIKSYFSHDPEYRKFAQSKKGLYDIIVQINSLLDLTKGWSVSYPILDLFKKECELLPNKIQTNLQKVTEEMKEPKRKAVVSILGLYNRGKSYILARIFELDLSSSFFTHTEGLSIVTSRANITEVLIGLDTKGSQKPVPKGKKSLIKDAEATERFLQTLSLNLSDVVIIVVNRLTRDDQSYIKQVKKTFKNTKSIIVVHNLTHVNTLEQIQNIIKEEIEDCFDGFRNQVGDLSPYWTSPDGTRHVVMAKDENIVDSENVNLRNYDNAGYVYNSRTIRLLQEWLRTSAATSTERCDIVDGIVKFSKQVITNYLEIDKNSLKTIEKSGDSSQSTPTSTPPLTSTVPKQLVTTPNPLQNIVLESPDKGDIMIKFNPPLPEGTVLKYADIRFNMVGIISNHINTNSRVEEDDQFYYLTLDCTGFTIKDLRFTFENANKASEISIQSFSPKEIPLRGNNIIHNDFSTERSLKWSYTFETKVTQNSSKDLTKENCSLQNGILNIKLTKFKNTDDGIVNIDD